MELLPSSSSSSAKQQTIEWIDRRENTPLNACSLEVLHHHRHHRNHHHNLRHDKVNENISSSISDDIIETEVTDYHPLVIGCYQLNEKKEEEEGNVNNNDNEDDDENNNEESSSSVATRSGALLLHMIPFANNNNDNNNVHDEKISYPNLKFGKADQILHTSSGVLDGKWFQRSAIPFVHNNNDDDNNNVNNTSTRYMYATACASGSIEIYQLFKQIKSFNENLHHETKYQLDFIASSESCSDEYGLALALDWDENIDITNSTNNSTRIVSSYSKGSIAIHNVKLSIENYDDDDDDKKKYHLEENQRWDAHTLFGCAAEVWTVCFATNINYSTYTNNVISGGDDCRMKLWDLRTCGSGGKPIHSIGDEEFSAGVTTLSYHPSLEHVFCSGSYDEWIRLWDMRKLSCSNDHQEPMGRIGVGGGVWRAKWHPMQNEKLLVAAMHGGCRIVNIPCLLNTQLEMNVSECEMNIVKEFIHHKSMAYGADWIHLDGKYEAAASCSFYDRQAFIW